MSKKKKGAVASEAAVPKKKKAAAAPAEAAVPKKKKKAAAKASEGGKSFRAGTANAAVFDLLSDQKPHSLQECYDASTQTGSKWPKDALWFVTKKGDATAAFTVTKDKAAGTVQLKFA